jgi:hypothetical protein
MSEHRLANPLNICTACCRYCHTHWIFSLVAPLWFPWAFHTQYVSTWPHGKKCRGIRSEEHAGQKVGPTNQSKQPQNGTLRHLYCNERKPHHVDTALSTLHLPQKRVRQHPVLILLSGRTQFSRDDIYMWFLQSGSTCGANLCWHERHHNTEWSKSLCAPDDYNTESYKQCSKCPPPVSRYLLTRRTVFSKTVFSIAWSTFWCVLWWPSSTHQLCGDC